MLSNSTSCFKYSLIWLDKKISMNIIEQGSFQLVLYQEWNSIFTFCSSFEGNPGLYRGNKKHFKMVVGISIGVLVILLILFLVSLVLLLNTRRKASQKKR